MKDSKLIEIMEQAIRQEILGEQSEALMKRKATEIRKFCKDSKSKIAEIKRTIKKMDRDLDAVGSLQYDKIQGLFRSLVVDEWRTIMKICRGMSSRAANISKMQEEETDIE